MSFEIKICGFCKGVGSIEDHDFRDSTYKECEKCKGTGRVIQRTYTLTLPLESKQIFYNKDREIIKIINEKYS